MWTVLLDRDMRVVGVEGYAVTATAFGPREAEMADE
jgi:hypothetical protein